MKIPKRVPFGGKMWDVTQMACGYMFRLTCGDKKISINFERLIQIEHGS